MNPDELFETYSDKDKINYFAERRDLIEHNILYEVDDIYNEETLLYKELNEFPRPQWLKIFYKIDALAFCCEFLADEAQSYKKYRENKRIGKIYIKELTAKDAVLITSIKKNIENVKNAMYQLKSNQSNINILNSLGVVKPPPQQIYFNEMNHTSSTILHQAGFTKKEILRISPLLKKLYKTKQF